MDGEPAEEATLFPATVGEKLRAAREAQGLDLTDVATRTRIPQRHLEAIEKGNYSGLPSPTYALGFAKAYARAVDADEVAIARDLRSELNMNYERAPLTQPYEMTDPTRTPPSYLSWVGIVVAVLLLVGVGVYYGTSLFRGSPPPPESLTPDASPTPAAASAQPSPALATGGHVSIVALDTVWVRVTDASGKHLFEKEMAKGERYDVPADADHPKLKTGRPENLQVTLNGSNLPPLGAPAHAVEVELTAAGLAGRGAATGPAPVASPSAAATPTARATPRPRASASPAAAPAPAATSGPGNATVGD